ncbi:MAG: hypothetical protein U9N83_01285 [Thermodesulfobacteriota bacterium]|nr:hypothetical protein [Thermodesulfobacteriota bacterium]
MASGARCHSSGFVVYYPFEFDRTADISPHIDDLLEAVKKAADQNKKDAVVVFDEFQEIVNFDGNDGNELEIEIHYANSVTPLA